MKSKTRGSADGGDKTEDVAQFKGEEGASSWSRSDQLSPQQRDGGNTDVQSTVQTALNKRTASSGHSPASPTHLRSQEVPSGQHQHFNGIQWNLSNTDSFGPIKCDLIREVSLFFQGRIVCLYEVGT